MTPTPANPEHRGAARVDVGVIDRVVAPTLLLAIALICEGDGFCCTGCRETEVAFMGTWVRNHPALHPGVPVAIYPTASETVEALRMRRDHIAQCT
jgi:hypothetical protein